MQRQRSQSLPPPVRRPLIPPIPRPFGNGVALYDAPVYLHTSTFRSANLELSIRSPRVRHVNDPKWIGQSIPVFSGKDSIGGTVITSIASNIATEHRLVISIEGAFFWSGPSPEEKDPTATLPLISSLPARLKHTFLSSLITISLLPDSHLSNPRGTRSRSNSATAKIGSALQASIKKTFFGKGKHPPPAAANSHAYGYKRKRRNSETAQPTFTSTPPDVKSSHAFSFPLPRENGPKSGRTSEKEEDGRPVPSSFAVSHVVQSGHRGRWYSESATVAYKIVVSVKPKSRERPRRAAEGVHGVGVAPGVAYEETLEVPIFIEPEEAEPVPDDPSPPNSWRHHLLHSAEPLEYACILSLPSPAIFSRFARIPFYVFVTTQPKSPGLAQKLIRHATIRVTLIRRIHLDTGMTFPAPEPRTRHPDDPLSPGGGGYLLDGGGGGSASGDDEGREDWMGSRGRSGSGSGSGSGSLLRRMSSRTPKIFKWHRQQTKPTAPDAHHAPSHAPSHPTAAPESVGSEDRSTPNTLSSVSFPGSTSQNTTSRTSTSRTSKDKPLPLPPPSGAQIFEDTLSAVTAEGFPRRVSRKSRRSTTQPEVIANSDAVLRADLVLNNELLNSVGWCGIGVDYFIEASVYYEDDILRVRAPVTLAGPYRETGTS